MTKRQNPFADVPPIQLKTHVTTKQLASEKEMQEVYKNTMARMFRGASDAFSKKEEQQHNGGVFCLPGSVHGSSTTLGKGVVGGGVAYCRSCKGTIEGTKRLVCSHCQHRLCGEACLRVCCVCALRFCQFCTVLNYDKADVRTFCMDCLASSFSQNRDDNTAPSPDCQ